MIGNKYVVPNDIFMTLEPEELSWSGIKLIPGDKFEIQELKELGAGYISNDDLNSTNGTETIGVTAMKINGIPYYIESVSVVTWCFLLLPELDYFYKVED